MRATPACLVALVAGLLLMSAAARAADSEGHVQALGAQAFEQREAATWALVELGDDALPALEAAAESDDPEVRWRAEAAARRIRRRVTPELAARAGDPFAGYEALEWFERERLVTDIASAGGRAAAPALARVLEQDESPAVRRAAAIGLLRLGPEGLLALEAAGGELLGLPPDDPTLRIEIGNGFLEEGRCARAAKEYERALAIAPESPVAWYNLACALSRLEEPDRAVEALRRALEFGFDDLDWLKQDPDLDNLREHPAYRDLLRSAEPPETEETED